MELPQNYRRIADSFDGLDADRKEAVIGHLRQAKDANELNKIKEQIIKNGGPEAELVGRIFAQAIDTGDGSGIRTVNHKKLEPIQQKDAGTGAAGAGHVPHDEPHTSTANPPTSGHEGKTKNQD